MIYNKKVKKSKYFAVNVPKRPITSQYNARNILIEDNYKSKKEMQLLGLGLNYGCPFIFTIKTYYL